MRIVLIGATGYVGSAIFVEALERGHSVEAVCRTAPAQEGAGNWRHHALDLAVGADGLAALLDAADCAISAFNPGKDATGRGSAAILAAARAAGCRLVVVGGAGTLRDETGTRLIDRSDFPAAWRDGAERTARLLDQLRAEPQGLDWLFVSPAAKLAPGPRTGRYRVGGDVLLRGADGESAISLADYACALIDEVETPRHSRCRISVAW